MRNTMMKSIMIILFSIFLTACGSKEPLSEDVSAEITMQGVEADINEDVGIGTLLSRTLQLSNVLVPITDVTITLRGVGSEDFNVTLEAGTTANSYIGKVALLRSLDGKGGSTYNLNATATSNGQDVGSVPVTINIINIPKHKIVMMCDADHGIEPWITDGTTEGTMLLKDVNPEGDSPFYSAPAQIGETFYLSLEGVLWKSDGSTEGTTLVKDINTSDTRDQARELVATSDTLYFSVYQNQLWKSDGNAENTVLVKEIATSSISSFATYHDKLYFFAIDGEHPAALWESDGTAEGTKFIKEVSEFNGKPSYLTFINDKLYFTTVNELELQIWESTTSSPTMEFIVNKTFPSSRALWMGGLDNALYIVVSDSEIAYLYKKEVETYTQMAEVSRDLRHIEVLEDFFLLTNMEESEGSVSMGSRIFQLWKSDGTEEGSELVKESSCPIPLM